MLRNPRGWEPHLSSHLQGQRGPGPGWGGCSVLLQPRDHHLWHWCLSPKTAELVCKAPSVKTGPQTGEISPADVFFPLPTGTDDTWGTHTPQLPQPLPCPARGLLPGGRGHPLGSPREGKQNVIFVAILHSHSKSFSSVLTSNLV